MLAEQTRQDQIANDLANASSPGYKPDRSAQASFGQLLLENTSTGQPVGMLGLGARISRIETDFTPGPLKQTGESLDLALDGQGFFCVQTPQGTRYTRDGQLMLAADGTLRTTGGNAILDTNGKPITVGSAAGMTVAADGTVSRNGRAIARIAVVTLANPAKEGEMLFTGTRGPTPAGTSVRQGALEGSTIDTTTAMVEMLTSLRAYQSDQQAIQAIDESLRKGIAAEGA